MELDFTVDGEQQLSRRLMIMADGVQDFTTPLKASTTELQKSFQDNFDARGGLFQSGGWPLREGEDKYKWPILEHTGALRNSFDSTITKMSTVLFNKMPYFKYHQSPLPRKTQLPRRVMMKIDSQRKTFIVKQFQLYLVTLMRG